MQIRAAVARAKHAPLTIETLTMEEPRADELVVRLVATGICHTDMSMRDHAIYPIPHPVVLGHEGAGIVERVGLGVTKLAPGDHVILTANSCGHCPSCEDGLPTYCYEFFEHNFAGTRADGSSPLSKDGEKFMSSSTNRLSPAMRCAASAMSSEWIAMRRWSCWGLLAAA